ncbi:unnamed protein product [Parnassius apollo]|uniref:(apollo) hypothetical protein n=1 Tax=Parnassius apollo TaxID=110799 RepID=A0A8S3X508_PARAO|nr:unnamed protein product [Parnassius apollo]
MPSCVVKWCKNNSSSCNKTAGITFHSFPQNTILRERWTKAVRLQRQQCNWNPNMYSKICSIHFKEDDFYTSANGYHFLKQSAVPNCMMVFSSLKKLHLSDNQQIFMSAVKKNLNPKPISLSSSQGDHHVNEEETTETSEVEGFTEPRNYITANNVTQQDKEFEFQVCRICLATDRKMYSLCRSSLRTVYEDVTGLRVNLTDGLPKMLCWECRHRLASCRQFVDRANHAEMLLRKLIGDGCYLYSFNSLKSIDTQKENLKSNLTKIIHPPNDFDINVFEISLLKDVNDQTNIKIEPLRDIDTNIEIPMNTEVKEGITVPNEQPNVGQFETYSPKSLINYEMEINENVLDSNEDAYKDPIEIDTKKEIIHKANEHENFVQFKSHSPEYLTDFEMDMMESNIELNEDYSVDRVKHVEIPIETEVKEDVIGESNDWTNLGQSESGSLSSLTDYETATNEAVSDLKEDDSVHTKCKEMKAVNEMQKKNVKVIKNDRKKKKSSEVLNPALFSITNLSYRDQVNEIEKRKESDNFKLSHYKCMECYKGFIDEDTFNAHMLRHSDKYGPHVCDICKIHFSKRVALLKHIHNHMQRFNCKHCSFVTTRRNAVKMHEAYHNGTKYQCPHCPESFVKSTTYLGHLRIKHPSDFVCELCGNSFIGKRGLAQHKNLKHRFDQLAVPEDGPCCEKCNIRFVSKEALQTHLNLSSRHKDELKPEVQKGRTPTDFDALSDNNIMPRNEKRKRKKRRYRSRKQEGPVPCEQCEMILADYLAYFRHFRREHPGMHRTKYASKRSHFMCEVCGKMFQGFSTEAPNRPRAFLLTPSKLQTEAHILSPASKQELNT